ncbi:MAG TPA: VapC toxin family PIN domain ribonuclease [Candidatus Taylorbacteria bacterium]|nr:MAG: Nucleotide binding protein [Parcubacteria group bacterium GW2011_GWA2_47_64]KKU96810.1 MAG: Nucleotide binding protein [Parcubacteria group bacterium GW2011_GWC2_48_17]HBV01345.1 VapC toxin family PIN domain ribonuclease [Candidatus Taylorbacteria bacterium]
MTLDTNIIILYLNRETAIVRALDEIRKQGVSFILPAAVEAEFLSFSSWTPDQRRTMEEFLEENFVFVSLDRPLARLAARIRVNTRIKFADASIAATALFTNTPLVTRNVRDFKKVPGLQVMTL